MDAFPKENAQQQEHLNSNVNKALRQLLLAYENVHQAECMTETDKHLLWIAYRVLGVRLALMGVRHD